MMRLVRIGAAYVLALVAGALSLVALFAVASWLPSAPVYWTVTAISPILLVGAPAVAVFLTILVIVVSAIPAAFLITLTEIFSLRAWVLYAGVFAVVAGGMYLGFSFRTIGGLDRMGMLEAGMFALSGCMAGTAYWFVAGKSAGGWNRRLESGQEE
jgi:hypothetical protein